MGSFNCLTCQTWGLIATKVVTDDFLGENPFHETCLMLWCRAQCTAQASGARQMHGLGGLGTRRLAIPISPVSPPWCSSERWHTQGARPSGPPSSTGGVVYRDSHCHLRGHPRGFGGDPQTPVLEGQQCAPWPCWAPACSQEAGRMEEEFLFRMEPW